MANTRSAAKRMRQNERRRLRNAAIRSRVKTVTRAVRAAIQEGALEQAREAFRRAVRILDKAATKGVLHPNAAARRKSRLARQLNALAARAAS